MDAEAMSENLKLTARRWTARALIYADVDLQTGQYEHDHSTVRISRPISERDANQGVRILDLYFSHYDTHEIDVREPYLDALDHIEKFLDRVAIAGWAQVEILDGPAILPEFISKGEQFLIAYPLVEITRKAISIGPDNLRNLGGTLPERNSWAAARLVRRSLAAGSPEEAWLYTYSALETIAEATTTEKVSTQCPKCKYAWDGVPASARRLRKILIELGIEQEESDGFRRLRGKVAHGSAVTKAERIDELHEALGRAQGKALQLVAGAVGLRIRRPRNVVEGLCLFQALARESEGTIQILKGSWTGPLIFPEVTEHCDPDAEATVFAGLPRSGSGPPVPNWLEFIIM